MNTICKNQYNTISTNESLQRLKSYAELSNRTMNDKNHIYANNYRCLKYEINENLIHMITKVKYDENLYRVYCVRNVKWKEFFMIHIDRGIIVDRDRIEVLLYIDNNFKWISLYNCHPQYYM